ncbi:unnamed protein product [Durusdinium trenchii]|uniref:Uncharacterized protein n=2 Tax=Durusdinium trenchii TaxID=1381693 RepID=A0ABP0I310_9DINO
MSNLLTLDRQGYRDHCLIVVGPGTRAEEVLAKRRLDAGGRLLHVLTDDGRGGRVLVRAFEDLEGCFLWQPPKRKSTNFAKRFGGSTFRTYWSTTGPDSFRLEADETLDILRTDGRMHHIRLLDREGRIEAEMSGEVILNPDMQVAQEFDVQVINPDLKACGTFSLRYMMLSFVLLLLWHTARGVVSIHFERHAENGDFPWWRVLLVLINGALFCSWGLSETFSFSFAGLPPTCLSHAVGIFAGIVVCVGASALQAGDLASSILAGTVIGILGPGFLYYRTRGIHPDRRFPACLGFTLANISGTAGPGALASGIILVYTFLLDSEQQTAATLFLPIATALAEPACVLYAKTIYSAFVVAKRPAVPGDTALINMPWMLIASHSYAESARLVGMFSSAVRGGEFTWLGSAFLTITLNVLARLGWMRWLAFQLSKRLLGVRIALAIAAPTAWSKLHDEVKIYGGYIRFIVPLALAASRAIYYVDISWDGPYAPIFNLSATCALPVLFLLEGLEDYIVINEWLPVGPLPPEVLHSQPGRSDDPTRLISVELRPVRSSAEEERRLEEFRSEKSATKSKMDVVCSTQTPELLGSVHAVGGRRSSWHSRLRRILGQERALVPALVLHGLREMSFISQLSAIACISEFTLGFIGTAIGPGYARGLCETGNNLEPLSVLWLPVPLTC